MGRQAWESGDLKKFGNLTFESGESSIYNFEAGSIQLKKIHEILFETKGVYGGRFSGAGFKGCAMALVAPQYKEEIEYNITKKYLKEFPELEGKFSVHFCNTADGVRI